MGYCDWDDHWDHHDPEIPWWAAGMIYVLAFLAVVLILPFAGIYWVWRQIERLRGKKRMTFWGVW